MKKFRAFILLFAVALCIGLLTGGSFEAHAAVEDKFKNEFFPSGIVSVPEKPYLQSMDDDTWFVLWFGNSDEMLKLNSAWDLIISEYDTNYFLDKYNTDSFATYVLLDIKVDNGPWLSEGIELNESGEYTDDEKLPYYSVFTDRVRSDNVNMQSQTVLNLVCDDYLGLLDGCIKLRGDERYLDLENHTYSFRFRYQVFYDLYDKAEQLYEDRSLLIGDWSEVLSIGKNGNQKKLKTPASVSAPEVFRPIKRLNDKGVWLGTIGYEINFSDDITDAERALIINEDAFEPIYLQAEVEVNDSGEFFETYTANPVWLDNGTRITSIDVDDFGGASKIKHICLRAYNACDMLDAKSEYAYAVPQVTGLKSKTISSKYITLTWKKLTDVDFYEIYDGNGKFIGKTDKNTNTFKVTGLKAGNDYTFKVRAVVNEIFVGKFSSKVTLPTKPVKSSIAAISSPETKTLSLKWKKSVGDGYQIQIATDSKFKKIVDKKTVDKANELTYSNAKLKSGTTYYVRVRAKNAAGGKTVYSAWSTVKSIKVN